MARSGDTFPPRRTAAELVEYAMTLRCLARDISDAKSAAILKEIADEMDAEADVMERQIKPDTANYGWFALWSRNRHPTRLV